MPQRKIWHSTDETIRPNEGVLCLFEDKCGDLYLGYFSEEDNCFISRCARMRFAPFEVNGFVLADDLMSVVKDIKDGETP